MVYVGLFDDQQRKAMSRRSSFGTGAEVWSRPLPAPPFGGVAEANGVVYVQADVEGSPGTPDTFALSSATGAVIWSREVGEGPLPPTVANGVLYLVELVPHFAFHTLDAPPGPRSAPCRPRSTPGPSRWSRTAGYYLLQSDGPILVLAP